MTDTRPRQSAMPPHLAAIIEELGPRIAAVISDAYLSVLAAGATAGDDPVTARNDALSLQAQLVAIAASLFVASLADAKRMPLALVRGVGMADVLARAEQLLDGVEAIADAEGATKQ